MASGTTKPTSSFGSTDSNDEFISRITPINAVGICAATFSNRPTDLTDGRTLSSISSTIPDGFWCNVHYRLFTVKFFILNCLNLSPFMRALAQQLDSKGSPQGSVLTNLLLLVELVGSWLVRLMGPIKNCLKPSLSDTESSITALQVSSKYKM